LRNLLAGSAYIGCGGELPAAADSPGILSYKLGVLFFGREWFGDGLLQWSLAVRQGERVLRLELARHGADLHGPVGGGFGVLREIKVGCVGADGRDIRGREGLAVDVEVRDFSAEVMVPECRRHGKLRSDGALRVRRRGDLAAIEVKGHGVSVAAGCCKVPAFAD